MLIQILGGIDLIASFTFLMLIFGLQPFIPLIIFCAGLLFIKSLFLFGGDVLSIIDLLSAIFLILSIFFTLPIILLWTPTFLLLAKGLLSYI